MSDDDKGWRACYEDFFDVPKRTTRWTRFKKRLGL